ncbi:MAG TPA: hypothetical protein EYP73_05560 [Acidimicrobiia bacterium]|nr:hypothetical protein [Acidimicrobiia bacterium]
MFGKITKRTIAVSVAAAGLAVLVAIPTTAVAVSPTAGPSSAYEMSEDGRHSMGDELHQDCLREMATHGDGEMWQEAATMMARRAEMSRQMEGGFGEGPMGPMGFDH